MLYDYFQHQADLANTECHFRCPDDCNAPGCRRVDVIVKVTLFDLIRLSLVLHTPVSQLFSQCCRLGLLNCEFNPHYKRLLVKLKKPCRFLKQNRCSVHHSKPLNCVLFPEFLQIKGLLPELANRSVFCAFPCLKNRIFISNKRSDTLKVLRKMSLRETALSDYYLFGVPSFIADPKPILKKLKRYRPKPRILSVQDHDYILDNVLKASGFFESVLQKISRLDEQIGQKNILKVFNDGPKMTNLMDEMMRPGMVHRLYNGRIKPLKRNLQRPEITFI